MPAFGDDLEYDFAIELPHADRSGRRREQWLLAEAGLLA